MEVNMTEIPMEEIEEKFSKFFDIDFGGYWKPKDCRPRWKVGLCFIDLISTYIIQTKYCINSLLLSLCCRLPS